MRTMLTLVACLLLPAFLAAQNPPAPAQPQAEKKEAMPAKTRHCAECNMDFKTAKEAKAHYVKAHGMKFYCAHCDKAFKSKAEMREHMKEAHSKKETPAKKA